MYEQEGCTWLGICESYEYQWGGRDLDADGVRFEEVLRAGLFKVGYVEHGEG